MNTITGLAISTVSGATLAALFAAGTVANMNRISALLQQYCDLPAAFADASLVALA